MEKSFPIHVRTLTGLENVLSQELTLLGATQLKTKNRLVTFLGDERLLYKANVECRTAIRVLRPLTSFRARNEKELYNGVRELDWRQWLKTGGTLAVDATVSSSFSTHSLFIAQLTKDAVVDELRERSGHRPSVDLEDPDLRIVISLFQDHAELSLNSSGESLHKRGYRQKTGNAPISEVLAAGILKLSGWESKIPLLDPMTGAGTFCIEAGLMAKNLAPGLLGRHYGFQKWPNYNSSLFSKILEDAKKAIIHEPNVSITGIELDPEVCKIAENNVRNAKLSDLVQIEYGDFFKWKPEPGDPGLVVMNPPYDERLGVDNVAELYQHIGDRLKTAYGGWTAFILSGNLEAVKYLGLRSSKKILLFNGPIETRLLRFEMREKERSGESPIQRRPPTNPQWIRKAEIFHNRLEKNLKHYGKWAQREKISCWRLYDWDIPELPYILEFYGEFLRFEEIPRNQEHSPLEHSRYQKFMVNTAAETLKIPPEKICFTLRRLPLSPRKLNSSPESFVPRHFLEIQEGNYRFLVDLSHPLDVGFDLHHRKTRALIEKEVSGQEILILGAYTGGFTVYAAGGGARSTVSIEASSSRIEWAERNLKLNGLLSSSHRFLRMEILDYLETAQDTFNLCVVELPAKTAQTHYVTILRELLKRIRPIGKIIFSTTFQDLEIQEEQIKESRNISLREITQKTTSYDFGRRPAHRTWMLQNLSS